MAALFTSALLRTQTDQRLAALASEGSEPAFEILVERYRAPLQAYCRRLLLDRTTSEDVVQQAFVSAWEALTGETEFTSVRAWLYRVVHNGALNALHRSGYRHEELDDALRGTGAPEEDLERRIAVRRTLAGLAALPELQREALLRTAVEGHSHSQVARELGLTDGAVRGLIYRARATLRTAATALTPAPIVAALAAGASRENAPMAERIAELVAGAGGAGATAVLAKGGATVLTVGALTGGAVVSERVLDRDDRPRATAASRASEAGGSGAAPTRAADLRPAARIERSSSGRRTAPGGRRSEPDRGPAARSGPSDGRAEDRQRRGRSQRSAEDDRDDDDRRGRGPGRDDADRDGDGTSRGPGPGPRSDNRGPGGGSDGGTADRDDSSGPGSAGGGDSKGSGGGDSESSGGGDSESSGGDDSGGDDSGGTLLPPVEYSATKYSATKRMGESYADEGESYADEGEGDADGDGDSGGGSSATSD